MEELNKEKEPFYLRNPETDQLELVSKETYDAYNQAIERANSMIPKPSGKIVGSFYGTGGEI